VADNRPLLQPDGQEIRPFAASVNIQFELADGKEGVKIVGRFYPESGCGCFTLPGRIKPICFKTSALKSG
jgi:hypothetical protein